MKQKLLKTMTEEELILSDPEWKAAIEEYEEAKRKGMKPWKLPQPWKIEFGEIFDDVRQGKPIHLDAKRTAALDERFLQSLSDIKAGRIRRVR